MTSDADKQQGRSDGESSGGATPARNQRRLGSELGRFEPVSDAIVLAAVERAERHREREGEGVMMSDIAERLGSVHGSWSTRRLRPQLDALIAEGSLARSRRHGVVVWELTAVGRGGLECTRRAGEVLAHGGQLRVVVPCHGYESAFTHKEDRNRYEQLLREATGIVELDYPRPSEDPFFAAGQRVVDISDRLIAVWDGEKARGRGGTADVVSYAVQKHKSTEVVWPDGVIRISH